jgi:DNA-binding MarR family transcriptional regulator
MRATDLYSRKVANVHQLTVPQLLCLLAVEQSEPVTVTAIAKEIHLSPSTVVGIVDRLCAKELVVRERDSVDRRVVNITLLERGREVAAKAPSPLQDRFLSAFEKLPRAEQENIAISLQRVVDLMEAEDLEAAPVLIAQPPQLKEPETSSPGK